MFAFVLSLAWIVFCSAQEQPIATNKLTSDKPLVQNCKKTLISNLETRVEVFGRDFLPVTSDTTSSESVTVTIGEVDCNIITINMTYIACNMSILLGVIIILKSVSLGMV